MEGFPNRGAFGSFGICSPPTQKDIYSGAGPHLVVSPAFVVTAVCIGSATLASAQIHVVSCAQCHATRKQGKNDPVVHPRQMRPSLKERWMSFLDGVDFWLTGVADTAKRSQHALRACKIAPPR